MTKNAQGPGWWQASDGNWYPPDMQPGHAIPAGQALSTATPESTVSAARFPVAAWILFGGFAIFLIAAFLPARASGTPNFSVGHQFWNVLMTAICIWLVWVTFTRPRPRLWSIITLTLLTSLDAFGWSAIVLGLKSLSVPPGMGVFVSGAAIGLLVVGVIMAWIAVSKARRP